MANHHILKFIASSKLILDWEEGEKMPSLNSVDIILETGKNLEKEKYFDRNGLPNKDGLHSIINCFIHGIAAAVKTAHKNGYRVDHEYMQYIVEQLTRAHATDGEVMEGTF